MLQDEGLGGDGYYDATLAGVGDQVIKSILELL